MIRLIFFIILHALLLVQPAHATEQLSCGNLEDQPKLACLSVTLLHSIPHNWVITPIIPQAVYPTIRNSTPIRLIPHIIERYPHDTRAFTQGLVLFEGEFYESTGLYGQSSLRRVTIETGEVQQQINLAPEYFAEGLALVDDRLIQITWREKTAFVYDRVTFEQIGSFHYNTDGWGLCYDGTSLYMSDGTPTIYERHPTTFEIIRTFTVTRDGAPQRNLNELACVNGSIYANVWLTDEIVRFNQSDGIITAIINAQGLLTPEEAHQADVLNGIVYDAEQDLYYITGKNWPYVFLVDFVPESNGE
jgi:glutamine cyclotransferase